jgi:hypothetical protein
MEGFLMPTNPESIRFARNWSDSPHIPLDDVSAEYESGMFARYLARRFSPALIADAWNTSAPLQEPFEILDSLIAAKQPNPGISVPSFSTTASIPTSSGTAARSVSPPMYISASVTGPLPKASALCLDRPWLLRTRTVWITSRATTIVSGSATV